MRIPRWLLEWLFRICVLAIPIALWGIDFGATCMAIGIPVVVDFRPWFYAEFSGASWLNWNYALGILAVVTMLLVFELYEKLVGAEQG